MESYGAFAQIYDRFMDSAEYRALTDIVRTVWKGLPKRPELVLDLACGTGEAAITFAKEGYEMIGVDLSADMLSIAREKADKAGVQILFLEQDMSSFELYGTVDSVICLCDGLNYLLDISDLAETFGLVQNYLNPGGVFVFDVLTRQRFLGLGDQTFAESSDDSAYIWENSFFADEDINEYALTCFIKNDMGSYDRFEEIHHQRAYSEEQIKKALDLAGLRFVNVFDIEMKPANKRSERLVFIAQRIEV